MPVPDFSDNTCDLYWGDCLTVMRELEPNSIDAICTDPPYEIAFMARTWDAAGISFNPEVWREMLRIAKPGAHLIAFGSTRTSHRMVCAIEDAGWQVRDTIAYMFGTGFPKSLDVGKAIDRAAGATRDVIGTYTVPADSDAGNAGKVIRSSDEAGSMFGVGTGLVDGRSITAPATPDAEAWNGWGTALKPAHEPITLARKPLTSTVAANVLEHGTGALNIAATRIEASEPVNAGNGHLGYHGGSEGYIQGTGRQHQSAGRWPANVILDTESAAMLDAQTGELQSGTRQPGNYAAFGTTGIYSDGGMRDLPGINGDRGGASRFFKTVDPDDTRAGEASADRRYTDKGGTNFAALPGARRSDDGGPSRFFYTAKASSAERANPDGTRTNHPTVKPLDLMRWLCRLITPPGGVILDPFAGSGTTLQAARMEGFRSIGIEQDADHIRDACSRLSQLSLDLLGGTA